MPIIKTIKGFDVIVSKEDYEYCKQIKWKIVKKGYVYGLKLGFLHRIILMRLGVIVPKGMVTDHIDRNKLNNQRDNLRVVSYSYNAVNRRTKRKYRGVYRIKSGKYKAQIFINSKSKHLGTFDNISDAAKAYDRVAFELYKQFAVLNFPDEKY